MPYLGKKPTDFADVTESQTFKVTESLDVQGNELVLDADGDTSITSDTDDQIDFKVAGSDGMHLTSTGLGLGTSSPSKTLHVYHATTNKPALIESGDAFSLLEFKDSSTANIPAIGADGDKLIIQTGSAGAKRFQITDGGNLNVAAPGNTDFGRLDGSTYSSGERNLYIWAGSGDDYTQIAGRNAADGSPAFLVRVGNVTRAEIESNGDYQSATNNYGGTSDQTLKENIVASGSQWDDIKAVQVKKFSYIRDDLDSANMIGVIAQDLEAAGMNGLVSEKDGVKRVKYSILYMKAIKALQEAMTKIETLETKVAALEAAD